MAISVDIGSASAHLLQMVVVSSAYGYWLATNSTSSGEPIVLSRLRFPPPTRLAT